MWNMQGQEDDLPSQITTQCEQCWHIVTDGRKQTQGLVIAVLASAILMNDAPRNKKEFPSFFFVLRA